MIILIIILVQVLCCHSITKITRNGINGAMFDTTIRKGITGCNGAWQQIGTLEVWNRGGKANRHIGSLEQRRERREEGTAHPHYQRTTKPSSLELAGPVTRPRVRAPTEGGRGSGQLAGGSGSAEGRRELARGAGRPWRRRQWRERRPNPSGGRQWRERGSVSGRGRYVWRWPLEALLSSNPSGLWASQFLTGPQTI